MAEYPGSARVQFFFFYGESKLVYYNTLYSHKDVSRFECISVWFSVSFIGAIQALQFNP